MKNVTETLEEFKTIMNIPSAGIYIFVLVSDGDWHEFQIKRADGSLEEVVTRYSTITQEEMILALFSGDALQHKGHAGDLYTTRLDCEI